jgi:methylthioxylose transferase
VLLLLGPMTITGRPRLAPLFGVFVAVGLAGLAMALPAITDWDVHVRSFPPLHAEWDPRLGPGTLPALLVGALAVWQSVGLAERLRWRALLLTAYAGGVAWLFSLAFVDGKAGVATILDSEYEYLRTARSTTDFSAALHSWIARIPYDGLPDNIPGANWPVHVAGHPPGALGFFIVLDRIGLGSGWWAGVVVTLLAASTAVAVLVTLRLLGAEVVARRAAPFLVFAPAAIWQCVSADAMFAAVAAWGIAALAAGAVRRSVFWSVVAGLLLGCAVMLSYGLPLLGLLAVAVLVVARTWRPLPWAVLAALAVVLAFAPLGFVWWEALPVLHDRYWAGVARNRPASYWIWGNLAALTFSAGPMMWAGFTALGRQAREVGVDAARTTRWLVAAAVAMVLVADLSQMSKGEVERIWLPFVPWLLVACGLLPLRWRRAGVAMQVALAVAVEHLLFTGW